MRTYCQGIITFRNKELARCCMRGVSASAARLVVEYSLHGASVSAFWNVGKGW